MISIIKLKDGTLLLSQVENITPMNYGDPNTKLTNPYQLPMNKRWLSEFTEQTTFLIDDIDILTIATPRPDILELYKRVNGILEKNESQDGEDEILDEEEII